MEDEERALRARPDARSRGAPIIPPSRRHRQRRHVRDRASPGFEGVQEVLPHGEAHLLRHGPAEHDVGDGEGELRRVGVDAGGEPRHRAIEPGQTGAHVRGERFGGEEGLEPEAVGRQGLVGDSRAREQATETGLSGEDDAGARSECAQRAEGGDGLEHVSEGSRMDDQDLRRVQ